LIRDPASGEKPTVFTCADDSRNIENLGLLVGQLAYGSGFGNRVTLRAYVAS
jgi:hypothetical protein